MRGPVAALRSRPAVADAVLAVVVFVFAAPAEWFAPPGPRHPRWLVLEVLLSCTVLAWRRRRPLAVAAVQVVLVAVALATDPARPFVPGMVVALYTVARYQPLKRAITLSLASALALVLVSLLARGAWVWDDIQTLLVVWPALATATGVARRAQREQVESAEDRAIRAEAARDEEARRQVAEERLRIARDLHDIVAHQIAVIGVQAGVAAQQLRTAPDDAETALGHVRVASREVLTELGAMLNVLRRPEDAPTEPIPGLDRAPSLFRTFENAGLPLRVTVTGRPRELASSVGLTAYRVLQESLTNAQKHGDGSMAEVELSWTEDALQLDVRNQVDGGAGAGPTARGEPSRRAAVPPTGTGNGLLGMTERAHAVGGSLTAQRTSGGVFLVRAVLPAPAVARL